MCSYFFGWLRDKEDKTFNEALLGKWEPMKSSNGVLFWDVSFFRVVHAQELKALLGFMETIYGSSIWGFGEDKMCWIPGKDKGFMVNDYYRILVGPTIYGFPWRSIWKQKIPSRVAFFV